MTHPCRSDPLPPDATPEQRAQFNDIQTYVRKEVWSGASILPGSVRSTIGWLSNGWRPVSVSGDDEAGENTEAQPVQALTKESTPDDLFPMQMASSYHHKGFLPTHDAMMMGIGFDQNVIDKKLQFTMRPFYGQNWHSIRHYYGDEITMNIDQRPDGLPWGKLSLGYVKGDDSMTDHGTGMDLHGDVDLTHNWQFTSGVRQNSVDGSDNYVMLRWKMSLEPSSPVSHQSR